jgi:hypothetical protein
MIMASVWARTRPGTKVRDRARVRVRVWLRNF